MEIEEHTNRNVRSDDLAGSGKQRALAVIDTIGHLRAVQAEQHDVDRASRRAARRGSGR